MQSCVVQNRKMPSDKSKVLGGEAKPIEMEDNITNGAKMLEWVGCWRML